MPKPTLQIFAGLWLFAALTGVIACTPKRIRAMTVEDLMEDRVTLDGILLKCNQTPSQARDERDCVTARIAVERLAKDVEPAEEARHNAEFERSREKLRLAQEHLREEQEAKNKVDPYNLPVVPVEPAAAGVATPGVATPGVATPSP